MERNSAGSDEMKTVVITGGGGYLGGQTALYSKEQG